MPKMKTKSGAKKHETKDEKGKEKEKQGMNEREKDEAEEDYIKRA